MKYSVILMTLVLSVHVSFCTANIVKNLAEKRYEKKEEFEIPITEDLMREHGLLNRVLLIYDEIGRRIEKNIAFPLHALTGAIGIIKTFVEEYHEKIEETYLFPLFEKHKKEVKLVRTLKKQHIKGREVTAQLQKLTATKTVDDATKKSIKNLLQSFTRMYRPHEAREDTILFPQVRSLMSEQEFKELGEKSDDLEHEIFGKDGFENFIKKVAKIEKDLGIYTLEQFTPVFALASFVWLSPEEALA